MNQFQKLLALTPYQGYLLISAMIMLPSIRLSLKVSGFNKTYQRIISQTLEAQIPKELSNLYIKQAKDISRIIDIASTHGFYQANCLTRSLLLLSILKKQNIACQLMIGVNQQSTNSINDFSAHAWVESEGEVLNDRSNICTSFKAFPPPYYF